MRTYLTPFFYYGNRGVLYVLFTGSIRFAFNLIARCILNQRNRAGNPTQGCTLSVLCTSPIQHLANSWGTKPDCR